MSYFVTDLMNFHNKFGLRYDGPPRMLPPEEQAFRLKFLKEELAEVEEAMQQEDIAQVAGELADLVWIAIGIAHRMGISFDHHWRAIAEANMAKVKASEANPGKRGSSMDIVKPEGWKRPNHAEILERTTETVEADIYECRRACVQYHES